MTHTTRACASSKPHATFTRTSRAVARTAVVPHASSSSSSSSSSSELTRAFAASALAFAVASSSLTLAPAALAGLNKSGNSDAYAEMMKQMEAERAPTMSAESLFKQGGGACGEGYELKVVKVLGASCECVADSCKDDTSRQQRTEMERSFGKAGEEDAAAEAPAGGIKFTFSTE
jgi:hypothetical protein